MSFDAEVLGMEELKRAWSYGCVELVGDIRRGAQSAGSDAAGKIRSDAPHKTGKLRAGVKEPRLNATQNGTSGAIVIDANHASFVKDGTDEHVIRPKKKKALFWEGAPHPVREVHHPGTKPNDFVSAGVAEGQANLEIAGMKAAAKLKARIEG